MSGEKASYGPILQSDLPLEDTIVIGVRYATTGQCGETSFLPASCLLLANGSTAKRQIK